MSKAAKLWTIAALGVFGLLLVFGSMYTVNAREVAVVLEFGKPVVKRLEPGLYFKVPLMQEVRRFPKTLQFWRSTAGETLVDLPTADKKKIEVDAWAVWRITDPDTFARVLITVPNAESAVKDRVRSAIRDEITSNNLVEVIRSTDRELTYTSLQFVDEKDEDAAPDKQPGAEQGAAGKDAADEEENLIRGDDGTRVVVGRKEILERIKQNVQRRLKTGAGTEGELDRGIELVDVGIYNISFVPAVREAAFERLKVSMQAIAAKYSNEGEKRKQVILNQTKAEVESITGKGEGESRRIRGTIDADIIRDYAKAIEETGDFYTFERKLELYKEALKGQDTRLILTTESELFQMLKQLEASTSPSKSN